MSDSSRTGFRHVQSKERENLLRRARKIALSAHFWPANWPAVGMRPLSPTVYQAQRGFQPTPLLSLRAPAPFHYLQIPEVKERETQSSSKDISGCAIATSTSKAKLFHCPWVNGYKSTESFLHWSPREQKVLTLYGLLCPKYYSAYIIFTHLILTMIIWNSFYWWGNWSTKN